MALFAPAAAAAGRCLRRHATVLCGLCLSVACVGSAAADLCGRVQERLRAGSIDDARQLVMGSAGDGAGADPQCAVLVADALLADVGESGAALERARAQALPLIERALEFADPLERELYTRILFNQIAYAAAPVDAITLSTLRVRDPELADAAEAIRTRLSADGPSPAEAQPRVVTPPPPPGTAALDATSALPSQALPRSSGGADPLALAAYAEDPLDRDCPLMPYYGASAEEAQVLRICAALEALEQYVETVQPNVTASLPDARRMRALIREVVIEYPVIVNGTRLPLPDLLDTLHQGIVCSTDLLELRERINNMPASELSMGLRLMEDLAGRLSGCDEIADSLGWDGYWPLRSEFDDRLRRMRRLRELADGQR